MSTPACGYCGKPTRASSGFCSHPCRRAYAALQGLAAQRAVDRRLAAVASRQAEVDEFERRTNADLAVLVHPRPPSARQRATYAENRHIAELHRCGRCGIDTTRPDLCTDCEDITTPPATTAGSQPD